MEQNKIKERRYEMAYDRIKHRMVTPEDVSDCDAHDRNRWFSEQFEEHEDKGDVLTLNLGRTYVNKKGTTITNRRHFAKIGANTANYRRVTAEKQRHQESVVHKLCKEIIKDIDIIKIPEVKTELLGVDFTIIPEQICKIKWKTNEQWVSDTHTIPDSIIEIEINGIKQEAYIEYIYKHEVNESKKLTMRNFYKNCLQLNLMELRDDLDTSEKELKKKIKNLIKNNCTWVSCRLQEIAQKDALEYFFIILNKENLLLKTTKYDRAIEENYYYKRLYFYKDEITKRFDLPVGHKCYAEQDVITGIKTYTDIGVCKDCDKCIQIKGYTDSNDKKVEVLCDKLNIGIKNMNPFEFVSMFMNKVYELNFEID